MSQPTEPDLPHHQGAVRVSDSGSRARLELSGEVDASMNTDMVTAINDLIGRGLPIDIDTRKVTFIDSSAMALLVYLANRVVHPLRFIQPTETVRFLMDITQLDDQVEVLEHDPGSDVTV